MVLYSILTLSFRCRCSFNVVVALLYSHVSSFVSTSTIEQSNILFGAQMFIVSAKASKPEPKHQVEGILLLW